jgi:hypothetical protein
MAGRQEIQFRLEFGVERIRIVDVDVGVAGLASAAARRQLHAIAVKQEHYFVPAHARKVIDLERVGEERRRIVNIGAAQKWRDAV